MSLAIPDLDDKTFEELVEEARSLIPRYAPEWTDHNLHDPGMTFIDLFAWLAEMQIYQVNQVSDAHYLSFLKMLGLSPLPSRPARAEIAFDPVTNEKFVAAETQVVADLGEERIVFRTQESSTLVPGVLREILTVQNLATIDQTQANAQNGVHFSAFGENPGEGAQLRLGLEKRLPPGVKIRLGFLLASEESTPIAGDDLEIIPSVDLVWEYFERGGWRPLRQEADSTIALTQSGGLSLWTPQSMAPKDGLYWLRLRITKGRYEYPPRIEKIALNVLPVVQIETIKNEDLGEGENCPEQAVFLRKTPIIAGSLTLQAQQDDAWLDWREVDDFEKSGPRDRHYVFDASKGMIILGNGLNGRLPGKNQKIRAAAYETTLGARGNLPGTLEWIIQTPRFEEICGENLGEISGGRNAETLEQAKIRAREELQQRIRAITSKDFEELALSTPGLRIARAAAVPNYHPDFPCLNMPGAVTVVVVPQVRENVVSPRPGDGFLQTVRRRLEERRLVTTAVHVVAPIYVQISVKCSVHVKKKSSPREVKNRVEEALLEFLNPMPNEKEKKKGWPFGRAVFPSEIYETIDAVEGVDYVTGVLLSAGGRETNRPIKIPPIALVYSGKHEVEAIY